MLKKYLILLFSSLAFACGDHNLPINCKIDNENTDEGARLHAKRFENDVKLGRLTERTKLALDAIVYYAIFNLKMKGTEESLKQAETIKEEWEHRFKYRDLGDHEPVSQWLAEKYSVLEFILGTSVMRATRLEDLKIINYAIPVIFKCVDNVDEYEFYLHEQPFLGTVSYWSSFWTCVGFTWGTGALYCGPLSKGVEWLVETMAAPRLNSFLWKKSCNKGDILCQPG